jgi:hypothetical protein
MASKYIATMASFNEANANLPMISSHPFETTPHFFFTGELKPMRKINVHPANLVMLSGDEIRISF